MATDDPEADWIFNLYRGWQAAEQVYRAAVDEFFESSPIREDETPRLEVSTGGLDHLDSLRSAVDLAQRAFDRAMDVAGKVKDDE